MLLFKSNVIHTMKYNSAEKTSSRKERNLTVSGSSALPPGRERLGGALTTFGGLTLLAINGRGMRPPVMRGGGARRFGGSPGGGPGGRPGGRPGGGPGGSRMEGGAEMDDGRW